MFRKTIKYAFMLLLLVVTATTIAFSNWSIDNKTTHQSNVGVGQDDIAENYSFTENAKKFLSKDYTLYLFPSTIYLDMYLDYLDGKSTVKPEDCYGYINPLLKDDGQIDYDPTGSVQYQVSNTQGDNNYLRDWLETGGTYANTYLLKKEEDRQAYYETVYTKSNWMDKTSAESYLWGDPEYDEVLVSYPNSDEQHNYRNLHQYDRFGFWPRVRKNEGRYLPLKIVVDENFSSTLYEEVVKRPLTDMGDPHGWYCYSFTLWSYVSILKDEKGNRTGYKVPYYARNDFIANLTSENQHIYGDGVKAYPALSSFCPTTVSQAFDLMGDFSIYADEEGIIRLFPKFSNGKTYDEKDSKPSTGETGLPCGFLNGGADALRMTPTYKTNSVFNQHDYYFTYFPELATYNYASNIGAAVLPNVSLHRVSNLDFQVESTIGYANWQGAWQTAFRIDSSTLDKIITSYGEGFYNVYLFLGDVGNQGTSYYGSQFSDLVSSIRTAEGKTGIFSNLAGKNLFEPATTTISSYKSISIAFEKVRDARIVMNVPSSGANESLVEEEYNKTNQYFRYLSEDVYTISAGLNVVENASTKTPINDKYQYCYILYDVDFTNAHTATFQIRFQKRYRDNLKFSGTSGVSGAGSDVAPNVDLIYDPKINGNDGTFTKEQRYINAFEYYFDARVATIADDIADETTTEQQVIFSLKDEDLKGIYNILMIYIPKEYYSATVDGETEIYADKADISGSYETHAAGFYLFAYRQTNVFLKILANNPTEHYNNADDTDGNNGFLIHNGCSNNMLIFQKEYALGGAIHATDRNEATPDHSSEYNNYTQPVMNNSLAVCLNTYINEWMARGTNPPQSITRVVIRDHVTGAIIGYYQEYTPTDGDTTNLYVEDGKYYKIVFEDFSIRKNYIFYLTTI